MLPSVAVVAQGSLFIDDCAGAAFSHCIYTEGRQSCSAGRIPGGPYELYWGMDTRFCVLAAGRSVAELEASCNETYDICYGACWAAVS